MNTKMVAIVGGALVVAAFLLGFVPQYLKARDLETQLNSSRLELASQTAQLQGDGLNLLIGYVYLQTNLKNYGLASEKATKLFDRARAMLGQIADQSRKNFLQMVVSKRDAVISGLAKGDPATLSDVQALFQGALDTAGPAWR